MRLVWSKDARADLSDVHDFYRNIDADIAPRIAEQAVAAARMLLNHLAIGSVVPETDKRKWRVPKTRYILIYRVDGGNLRIVRVLHGAQNWRQFLA